jgi:tetratricopeptide (TPR) repeat protein
MKLFPWLFADWSVRSEALSLYKQGLARAEQADSAGAMEAYTAAVDLPAAPDDVRAMALYNRALLYAATGKTAQAVGDLNAVLALPASLRDVKMAARRRLDRMRRQQDAGADLNRDSRASR